MTDANTDAITFPSPAPQIPLPFVFAHYGARLRAKSRYSL